MTMIPEQHPASWRDPGGFIFRHDGRWYRQVNRCYERHYRQLMDGGLYRALTANHLLLPHEEVNSHISGAGDYFITLLPEQLTFTSYAQEWCFDQLKDAALLTLRIAQMALDGGMNLKDATPYNIQFVNGRPVLIDTLSFEVYEAGKPWIAYRQFCECFLYPLLLHHYGRMDTTACVRAWPDGIPATNTVALLPRRSRFNLGAWLHAHLPARYARKQPAAAGKERPFSTGKLRNLLSHLQSVTESLQPPKSRTVWNDYYSNTILSRDYLLAKEEAVLTLTKDLQTNTILDAGCNDGYFSLLLAKQARLVVAADFDSSCINNLYKDIKQRNIKNLVPLCVNLVLPTPAIGFQNRERASFISRNRHDLVLALALVHHLAIGHNIPLGMIAECFAAMGRYLLIEFVPRADEKVQLLLRHREDIFGGYTQEGFETAFSAFYNIQATKPVPGSTRTLYLMQRKID